MSPPDREQRRVSEVGLRAKGVRMYMSILGELIALLMPAEAALEVNHERRTPSPNSRPSMPFAAPLWSKSADLTATSHISTRGNSSSPQKAKAFASRISRCRGKLRQVVGLRCALSALQDSLGDVVASLERERSEGGSSSTVEFAVELDCERAKSANARKVKRSRLTPVQTQSVQEGRESFHHDQNRHSQGEPHCEEGGPRSANGSPAKAALIQEGYRRPLGCKRGSEGAY